MRTADDKNFIAGIDVRRNLDRIVALGCYDWQRPHRHNNYAIAMNCCYHRHHNYSVTAIAKVIANITRIHPIIIRHDDAHCHYCI